eukprot:5320494-Pleurochrysis_carterae.AAC.1
MNRQSVHCQLAQQFRLYLTISSNIVKTQSNAADSDCGAGSPLAESNDSVRAKLRERQTRFLYTCAVSDSVKTSATLSAVCTLRTSTQTCAPDVDHRKSVTNIGALMHSASQFCLCTKDAGTLVPRMVRMHPENTTTGRH